MLIKTGLKNVPQRLQKNEEVVVEAVQRDGIFDQNLTKKTFFWNIFPLLP